MRIAILSSAPSILDEWEAVKDESWDVVVGISTTCWFIDVDWMCWMDAPAMVGMVERSRKPRIGSVWVFDDFKWAGAIKYEAFPTYEDGTRSDFTLPNALNWAFRKWPLAEVCVFGDSCQSGPNVAGMLSMNPAQALVETAQALRSWQEHAERVKSYRLTDG
jgi:hypothetical protein